MPYISVESGALTAEQKKELIERLTATAAEIIHIPAQFFTVTIKELPDENFGIGGKSRLSCNSWGINLCNFPSMHTPLLIYTGRTSYLPLHEMKP